MIFKPTSLASSIFEGLLLEPHALQALLPILPSLHEFLALLPEELLHDPVGLVLELGRGLLQRYLVLVGLVVSKPRERRADE